MGVVLDTSFLIDVERSGVDAAALGSDERLLVSIVTVAEFMVGIELADDAHRTLRQQFLDDILETATILPFDLAAARIYAEIVATLRRRGEPVGERDAMIAATALAHGHSVMTANVAEFSRIPGLTVLAGP